MEIGPRVDTLEKLEAIAAKQFEACPYGEPAVRVPPEILLVNANGGLEPTMKIRDLIKWVKSIVYLAVTAA